MNSYFLTNHIGVVMALTLPDRKCNLFLIHENYLLHHDSSQYVLAVLNLVHIDQ